MFCISSSIYAQDDQDSSIAQINDSISDLEAKVQSLSDGQNALREQLQTVIGEYVQLREYVIVVNARTNFLQAQNNVTNLNTSKTLIEAKLELAGYKVDDNWEEIRDGFVNFIESIQIDPAGIITASTATTLGITLDFGEVSTLR